MSRAIAWNRVVTSVTTKRPAKWWRRLALFQNNDGKNMFHLRHITYLKFEN